MGGGWVDLIRGRQYDLASRVQAVDGDGDHSYSSKTNGLSSAV
ncbi:hypothetical protein E9O_08779 [Moraxella catarrhalis 12P80B1]|nr:hypothetical protein E9O_08779 [Moraxella catarrhalis 12P80B1]